MNTSAVNMPANTFDRYMGQLTQDFPSLQLSLADGADKKEVADKVAKELNKKVQAQVMVTIVTQIWKNS